MTPIILTVVAISFASAGAMLTLYVAANAVRYTVGAGLKL